ncbi:MAG: alpha/beta hydrolase, partial [Alphaproteobacteria bacterium]|nr:alpha/beta hydrolase [Alphaproteobacteria bacterium]
MSVKELKPAKEYFVETPSGRVRVWEKGRGKRTGYFAGLAGLPKWTPFLEELSKTRCIVAPSLPGFPGGAPSDAIDSQLDWVLAAGDAFDAAGLEGCDLIGESVGGALAGEVAAAWPSSIRKLVLIAPFGMFDEKEPVADVFAQQPGKMTHALSMQPQDLAQWLSCPPGANASDWEIMNLRAHVASAAIVWPLGDTRIARRLPRIAAKTLLLWGEGDRVIPPSYAKKFAAALPGGAKTQLVKGAGHFARFD